MANGKVYFFSSPRFDLEEDKLSIADSDKVSMEKDFTLRSEGRAVEVKFTLSRRKAFYESQLKIERGNAREAVISFYSSSYQYQSCYEGVKYSVGESSSIVNFDRFYTHGRIEAVQFSFYLPGDKFSGVPIKNAQIKKKKIEPPETLWKCLLTNADSFDFTLVSKMDESRHGCHKLVLAATSEYFAAKINNSLQEEDNSTASFDMTGATLAFVRDFMYHREIKLGPKDDVLEILDLAKMLFIQVLVDACEVKAIESVSKENALDLVILAKKYDLRELKSVCLKIIAQESDAKTKLEELNDISLVLDLVEILQLKK